MTGKEEPGSAGSRYNMIRDPVYSLGVSIIDMVLYHILWLF